LFFGPVGIVFLELFPTRNRYSGAAIGYNAAYLVFGGTAPLFSTYLVEVTGSLLAPAVYMAVLAACVFLVAIRLPESYKSSLVHREDHDSTAGPFDDVSDGIAPAEGPARSTAEKVAR
jgi:MHS family proline/betaine transporter-like MFS transporter